MFKLLIRITIAVNIILGVLILAALAIAKLTPGLNDTDIVVANISRRLTDSNGDFLQLIDINRRLDVYMQPDVDHMQSARTFYNGNVIAITYNNWAREEKTFTYGIELYDLTTQRVRTLYENDDENDVGVSSIWQYQFMMTPDQTTYVLTDPITYTVYAIDADTLERREIYQFDPEDRSAFNGDQFTGTVNLSFHADKLALIENAESLLIFDLQGNLLNTIDIADKITPRSRLYWINEDHIVFSSFSPLNGPALDATDGGAPILMLDTTTGDIDPITENLRGYNVSFSFSCEHTWISFFFWNADKALFEVKTMNMDTGEQYMISDQNIDRSAYILPGCEYVMLRKSLESVTPETSYLEEVYVTDLKGENVVTLGTVSLFNFSVDANGLVTYNRYSEDNQTIHVERISLDAPDDIKQIASFPAPVPSDSYQLYVDKGFIIYLQGNTSRTYGNLFIYDLDTGDKVQLTDAGSRIITYWLLP